MAETPPAPRFLFVPVSGARGSGEFYRSLTLAQAVLKRWPLAQVRFVVNREAGYASGELAGSGVTVDTIDGSPTRNTAAIKRILREHRPHIVIFDSAGRQAQLACARRLGANTVYISSRPKTRWKGFRVRRMRLLDQHWLAWPEFLGGQLTRWERFKMKFAPGVRIVHLGPLFPPADAAAAPVLARLGVQRGGYILFCAGGGGYTYKGRSVGEIFGRAAGEVARAAPLPTVWVRGPNYVGSAGESSAVKTLDSLSLVQMVDILAGARLAVINGGSLLLQALALKVPSIAAPIAGDQSRRIGACATHGLTVPAALDADALIAAVRALLNGPAELAALRARLETLGLANGIEPALAELTELMRGKQLS